MKYMIAGSHQNFLDTLRDRNENPKDWKYVSQPQQLYGIHNVRISYGFQSYLSPAWEMAERINQEQDKVNR